MKAPPAFVNLSNRIAPEPEHEREREHRHEHELHTNASFTRTQAHISHTHHEEALLRIVPLKTHIAPEPEEDGVSRLQHTSSARRPLYTANGADLGVGSRVRGACTPRMDVPWRAQSCGLRC